MNEDGDDDDDDYYYDDDDDGDDVDEHYNGHGDLDSVGKNPFKAVFVHIFVHNAHTTPGITYIYIYIYIYIYTSQRLLADAS